MDESLNPAVPEGAEGPDAAYAAECGTAKKGRPPGAYSALALAWLGDAVFELAVRSRIAAADASRPKELNRRAVGYVSAKAQSAMMDVLEPLLTEEEAAVYRRGRNANSPTMAKNASVAEYRRATGLEALIGYLYVKGDAARIEELIDAGAPGIGTEAQACRKK